jgi:hypothetical protein
MLHGDLLNRGPHFHFFFYRCPAFQVTIETRSADLGKLTYSLGVQVALQRHHFLNLDVDAFPPLIPLYRRRASTFCKAPLKKSNSSVFSASNRFTRLSSTRSVDSCGFASSGLSHSAESN